MTRWIALLTLVALPAPALQDDWTIVALRFDSKGVLYAADARGARVHAIETAEKAAKVKKVAVDDLGSALAAVLKANAGDVYVSALAIHPVSHSIYLAASRVRGGGTTLFRINDKGELEPLAAKGLKMKTVALPKGVQPLDLVIGPKGLVVSSMTTDKTFQARLHTLTLPLADGAIGTAESELYHTSHEAWETEAPLMSMTSFEKDGKSYVLASTACTPVVRFDAADVADKKKVRSSTVVELGMGNAPVTLSVYTKDKKQVLLVTSEEDTYRVDGAVITETTKINEKAITRNKGEIADVKVLADWKGVSKTALLDESSIVAVKRGQKLSLVTLDLP